jgi:hypothetical protein
LAQRPAGSALGEPRLRRAPTAPHRYRDERQRGDRNRAPNRERKRSQPAVEKQQRGQNDDGGECAFATFPHKSSTWFGLVALHAVVSFCPVGIAISEIANCRQLKVVPGSWGIAEQAPPFAAARSLGHLRRGQPERNIYSEASPCFRPPRPGFLTLAAGFKGGRRTLLSIRSSTRACDGVSTSHIDRSISARRSNVVML